MPHAVFIHHNRLAAAKAVLDAFQNQPGLTPVPAPTPANPGEVLADQDKYRTYGTLAP